MARFRYNKYSAQDFIKSSATHTTADYDDLEIIVGFSMWCGVELDGYELGKRLLFIAQVGIGLGHMWEPLRSPMMSLIFW
jgi:hypothetical protein